MENASKALIIAGAILLSILIIALGIFVFNQAKNATNTDSLQDMNVSTFNQVFTDYNGSQYGSQVASLLDQVATNASTNKDADERLIDIVYIYNDKGGKFSFGTGVTDEAKISTLKGNFKSAAELVDSLDDDKAVCVKHVTASAEVSEGSTETYDNYVHGISSLRSKLSTANKHKFQVACATDPQTGLVKTIAIHY